MSDPSTATAVFEQRVSVTAADLDEQAHVNNVVYVRWVQDAATAHWLALATPEMRAEVAWVLLRHELDYRRPAVAGDEVVVRTRVGRLEGITFERLTDVRRTRDDRVLVESRTLWAPINPRTGRPRRVSEEMRALFSTITDAASGNQP